jgi:predicted anti-sigma-YlaC factor YlaD
MTKHRDPAPDPDLLDCHGVRALARQAIIAEAGEPLPGEAKVHLLSCPECRAEVEEIARVDAIIAGAFQSVRRRIPGPSTREIDQILSRIREQPPAAKLLSKIRRSVNRMLWLTLIVLSTLVIVLVARAVAMYLKRH